MLQSGPSQPYKSMSLLLSQLWTCTAFSNWLPYIPRQQKSPPNFQHAPSNHPTHFPLLNRMTTEMRCRPQDHPQDHDTPPDSSPIVTPCNNSCQALYHIICLGFTNAPAYTIPNLLAEHDKQYTGPLIDIKEYCYGVVHPVTKASLTTEN